MKNYFVYMMSSANNKVLYIGVTNDLPRRAYEHRNGLLEGFTKKYNCKKLVWFKQIHDINRH
jgi:putative endonuclease